MIRKAYSIRDKKTEVFNQPIFAVNDEDVKRTLTMYMNQQKQDLMAQYPEDYTLYWIGQFDDHNGGLEHLHPVEVCELTTLVKED